VEALELRWLTAYGKPRGETVTESMSPEELRAFWEHVKRVSAEVRRWPEWKKTFACDLYSFPRSVLEDTPEQEERLPKNLAV
jgi:hypothetical protein